MKVYLSSDGAILQTIPSTIGRGSTMTDFEVEAPFSAVAITVRFGLRKGTTEPLLLKRVSNVSSPGLNVWTAKLPYAVTEYAGTVTYTIDIQDSDGYVIKSPSGTLSISPGAIPTMPSSPPQDAWTQMINYLSAIYDAAANGSGEMEELESKIAELKRWITDFETTRSVTDDSGEVPVIYQLVKSNLVDRLDELVNTGRTVVGGNAMSLVHDSVLLWLKIWAQMLINEEMLAGNSVQSEEILQVTGGKHIRFTADEEMEPLLEMLKEYEAGEIGGSPGVYVQEEEPTDPDWTLWIKPTGGYNLRIPDATAEMTQPVGRNADGQLVTAPGGGGANGLTAAQISALDGLFRLAAYTGDASTAYAAFRRAFGLTDSDDGGGDDGNGGGDNAPPTR